MVMPKNVNKHDKHINIGEEISCMTQESEITHKGKKWEY